jgi:hypothetical protein
MKTLLLATIATAFNIGVTCAEPSCNDMDPGINSVIHKLVAEETQRLESGKIGKENVFVEFTDLYPQRLQQYVVEHRVTKEAMNHWADLFHVRHHCFPDFQALMETLSGK